MRVGICTGGGDAPGLNAVIRAVVVAAHGRGWEVVGIRDGYNGLLEPQHYAEPLIELQRETVRGITHLGGTILGTTNRGNPLRYPVLGPEGSMVETDRCPEVVEKLKAHGIEALICLGGDGSMEIANRLHELGVRVIGVPKTIDNDLDGTFVTFGFDTAVAFATECIDRLHSTAEAHQRIMLVEVMGRYAGWIALHAGLAGTADVILLPEVPYSTEAVARKISERNAAGRHFTIVVVAEGAHPSGGTASVIAREVGRKERLGGAGLRLMHELEQLCGQETRCVVLGHLLRGGSPTSADRLISLRFGAAAVRGLAEGQSGVLVALDPPHVRYIPLRECTRRCKTVPVDCDTVQTARDLGVYFGDEVLVAG